MFIGLVVILSKIVFRTTRLGAKRTLPFQTNTWYQILQFVTRDDMMIRVLIGLEFIRQF